MLQELIFVVTNWCWFYGRLIAERNTLTWKRRAAAARPPSSSAWRRRRRRSSLRQPASPVRPPMAAAAAPAASVTLATVKKICLHLSCIHVCVCELRCRKIKNLGHLVGAWPIYISCVWSVNRCAMLLVSLFMYACNGVSADEVMNILNWFGWSIVISSCVCVYIYIYIYVFVPSIVAH